VNTPTHHNRCRKHTPLPPEIWFAVLTYLRPKDACISCTVCSSWHQILQDPKLWRNWHVSKVASTPMYPLGPEEWKESYKVFMYELYICPSIADIVGPGSHEAEVMFARAVSCGATVLVADLLPQMQFIPKDQVSWILAATQPGKISS